MDYEKKLKDALKDGQTDYEVVRWIESNFPELTESEDERNRKDLLNFLQSPFIRENIADWKVAPWIALLEKQGGNNNQNWKPSKSQINALEHFVMGVAESGYASPYDDNTKLLKSLMNDLRKLKEQGEQKPILNFKASNWYVSKVDGKIHDLTYNPADKIEPKFKVGDWVVYECGEDSATLQIKNIVYGTYEFTDDSTLNVVDEDSLRLWAIQDAEEGDVLVDVYGDIGIFQKNDDFDWSSYCSLGSNGEFRCFAIEHESDRSHPATKEQRDTLEKAMADAGYWWDAEYKELQKIEQKPTDKVEPKFKIEKGKWYVCIKDLLDSCANKVFCEGDTYLSTHDGSLIPSNSNVPFEVVCPGKYFRDWNIQDAKDGDVLAEDSCIFIIERMKPNGTAIVHCCLFDDGDFDSGFTLGFDINSTYPVTKEQRDLLFQKMKEAGYEWDADAKELKKIHIIDEGKSEMDYCFTKMMNGEKVSPAWSEEDDENLNRVIGIIERREMTSIVEQYKDILHTYIYWLKSLKQRFGGK